MLSRQLLKNGSLASRQQGMNYMRMATRSPLLMANSVPLRTMANKINGGSEVEQAENFQKSVQQKQGYLQFSREPTAKNFGDLERGEIPAPLQFDRPMETTVTQNGIRVCTETMKG